MRMRQKKGEYTSTSGITISLSPPPEESDDTRLTVAAVELRHQQHGLCACAPPEGRTTRWQAGRPGERGREGVGNVNGVSAARAPFGVARTGEKRQRRCGGRGEILT